MSVEQAMAILADVCRQFRGTLTDHEKIQMAIATISAAIKPAEIVSMMGNVEMKPLTRE